MSENKKSIILLGIKHSGKSTQGKLAAKHFECDFFDTDDEITRMTGKTPRQIYTESGQEAFLKAEEEACRTLAESVKNTKTAGNGKRVVIATGGGICNNKAALEELHKIGIFVFLDSDEETACNRIVREIKYEKDGSMSNLPAYIAKENPSDISDVRKIFHGFYTERQKIYKSICDISVKLAHSATKQENCGKIISAISDSESGF
ncbi:MAG: shikimate kinase [Treponema sp.]|nr:shikimate kinase [Treponema sp.]